MATLYDEFLGNRGNQYYVSDPAVEYPEDANVLGTTLLPRVYGKDLQAFEIASSGIVTVTLDDVRSLDVSRDMDSSNVLLSTLCNDSFEINVNSSNVRFTADGVTNEMELYAEGDMNLKTLQDAHVNAAENMNLAAEKDMTLVGSNNVFMSAVSNMELTSTNEKSYVSKDMTARVGGHVDVASSNEVSFTGTSLCNVFTDTVTIEAGQNFVAGGDNSALLTSMNHVEISGVENNMNVIMDDVSQTFRIHTNYDLKSTASNNMIVSACNDLTIEGKNELQVNSKTFSNDVQEDFSTVVGRNMNIDVTSNYGVSAKTVSNVSHEDTDWTANRDMYLEAVRYMNLTSEGYSNDVMGDIFVGAGRDMVMNIGSNMETIVGKRYDMDVNDGAAFMTMDGDAKTFTSHADSNYAVTASNNLTLDAQKELFITSHDPATNSKHYVEMRPNDGLYLSSTGKLSFEADDGVRFKGGIIDIGASNVSINGNLNVQGVLNSTSVIENRLEIEDKLLNLATTSNFLQSLEGPEDEIEYEKDGIINDGAGMVIHGMPSNAIIPSGSNEYDMAHLYEKSIRWNQREKGVLGLGQDNIDQEAIWEVRGGSLYLTNKRVDENGSLVNTTSFGFRINKRDELELVKHHEPVGGSAYSRKVAKFGFSL